jgi:hypothetical protein
MKKSHPKPRAKRSARPSVASRLLRSVARLLGLPARTPGKPKQSTGKAAPASRSAHGSPRSPTRDAEPAHRPRPQTGSRPIAPTKAETALLRPFAGLAPESIHLPKTKAECEAAAREILAAGIAGFDTEAKPTFRAGEKSGGPHVVQFALTDRAFIFQLHHRAALAVVAGLLESGDVLKVGFGLKNDHGQIRTRFGVTPNAVLDLDHIFRKMGYSGQIGVRAAMGALLGLSFPKSKSITTSNWAAATLTPRQIEYAANDAFAALKIMEALDLKPPFDCDPAHSGTARKARARRGRRRRGRNLE